MTGRRVNWLISVAAVWLAIVLPHSSSFGQSKPPTPAQLTLIVKSGICPKPLTTYDDISYVQHCGPHKEGVKYYQCLMEADGLNNKIYAYNDFVRSCRESLRRLDGSGQSATTPTGANPAPGSSSPAAVQSSGESGDFCSKFKYADQQIECQTACKKDAHQCEQYKELLKNQTNVSDGTRGATAPPLRERATNRECRFSDAPCFGHCRSVAEMNAQVLASGCTPSPGSIFERAAKAAAAPAPIPAKPAARGNSNGCPPGMVHDTRINANECIRREYVD